MVVCRSSTEEGSPSQTWRMRNSLWMRCPPTQVSETTRASQHFHVWVRSYSAPLSCRSCIFPSSSGQVRENHLEGQGDFRALSCLLQDPFLLPVNTYSSAPPPSQLGKLSLLLRCPVLDDLAKHQNIPLLCLRSLQVLKEQGTSNWTFLMSQVLD